MHDINSLYTKMFNSKYNSKGHLFEARFKTNFADKDAYLLPLVRHMHRNPKRERMVYDPKEYPYSSLTKYLDGQKREEPDMKDEIEEVFGKLKGREADFENYCKVVSRQDVADMKKTLKKRILGTKDFSDMVKGVIEKSANRNEKAKLIRKSFRAYVAMGVAAFVMVLGIAGFLGQQALTLKTEYDKTLATYDSTIKMLKSERDKAIMANKSAEEYAWKIRVAEEALSDLKSDREAAKKRQMELDGYQWNIGLKEIGGQGRENDVIVFTSLRVKSERLNRDGFIGTQYSKRVKRGKMVWETIQRNGKGESASWKGEWDGNVMRGVMRREYLNGLTRDYSFTSMGARMPIGR